MIKIKLNEISKINGKLNEKLKLLGKVGSNGSGVNIQDVLDSITVSNGIKDTREINKLDISGEDLQTASITNLEIENILKL